jgi:hypothetical protein
MKKILSILITSLFLSNVGYSQTGSCLNFDGVNDNCSRAPLAVTQGSNLTLEVRANFTGTSSSNQYLAFNGLNTGTAACGYGMLIFSGQSSITIHYGGQGVVSTGIPLNAGTWNMYSLVFGSTNTFTMYVNGVSTFTFNSGVNPTAPSAGSFVIGGNGLGTETFNGTIDEVRLWNRALCASEVAFRSSCSVLGNESGLVAAFNFNQGTASGTNTGVTTLNDLTANANNCTLVNFALTGSTSNWINSFGTIGSNCSSSAPLTATISPVSSPSICLGSSTTLSALGLTSYTWSNASNAVSVSVSPTVTTSYSVIGSNTTTGCFAVAQQTVFVYPSSGVATISPSSASICSGNSATLSVSGASTYVWSNASTATSIVVSPTTTTLYTLTATSAASLGACTSTAALNLTVTALPTVSIASTPTAVCVGSSATLTASGAATYLWSNAVSTASFAASPTVNTVYTATGTSNGCSSSASFTLAVIALPTVVVSGNATICAGQTTTLTASAAGVNYLWSTSQTASAIAVSPTATTIYTVVATSTAGGGCQDTKTISITVNSLPSPTISAASTSICSGSSATLSVSGASTYVWSTASTASSIVVSPTTTTLYTLTATSAASLGTCSNTTAITLTIVTTPTVSVVSSPTAICNGTSAILTATGATTYSWSTSATTNTISVSPTVTTVYTVTGNNSTCANTRTFSLLVNTIPTVAVADVTLCTGQTRTLTATGANTYTWSTTAISNTISVSPSVTTVYTITGTSLAGCVSTPTTETVTVLITPTNIGFSQSTTSLCSGSTATLTGTGTFTSYSWNSGAVPNGASFFPSTASTPSGVTGYTVVGTAANGCTASAVANMTIIITPSAGITTSTFQICPSTSSIPGGTATITAPLPLGASITWSPTNPATSTIAVNPSVTTIYTATRVNLTCTDISTIQITVNTIPGILSFANPTLVCAGKPSTITAGGALTYTWLPSTLTGSTTGQVVTFNPQVPTTYTIVGSNGLCLNTATIALAVNPNPTISISTPSAVICLNQSSTLTANTATASPAISYSWIASTGTAAITTPTDNPIVISPTTTTSYSVIVTNTFNCSSTTSSVIVVNSLPNPTVSAISNKTLVCSGGATSLAITPTTGLTYSWSTGNLTRTVQVFPLATTIYFGTATSTLTGCKNTSAVTIYVFTPTISVVGPTATCFGGNITLTGSMTPVAAIPSFTWNGNYFFQNFSATPTVSSIYIVAGTTSSNNIPCQATTSIQVTIYVNPTVSAVASPSAICRDEVAVLTGSGALSYAWSSNQTGTSVSVTPQSQTTYTVIGTDVNGCKDTNTVLVKVSFCTGISKYSNQNNETISVYPNPNNGEFMIQSDAEVELDLINELGQVIKKIKVINGDNNKVSANDLPAGIYYISGEKDGVRVRQKLIINKD